MKIAVTSQDRHTVTGHAGKCRNFLVYEVDGQTVLRKTLIELPMAQSLHESHGAAPHPLDGIGVLISGGAGPGLIRRLNNLGIQALVTLETEPDSAVTAFLNGTLKLEQGECHEGHGEHHDARHGCCH